MADLLRHVRESGFAFPDRLIHLFVGGSELHGAKVHGTDDLDIYGLYIEPPELVLGLESLPHFVWSTAGNDRRNGPNDVDITLYSLKKWAGLACKGNPTALHFLFAESDLRNASWAEVVRGRKAFLARTFVKPFVGFADDQLKRMTGAAAVSSQELSMPRMGAKGRGKKGQRPEIEEKYGYDVKAAMHTLRLLNECKELLSAGRITLPRPERNFLIRVRTGKYSMDKVVAMAQKLFAECEEAAKSSPLPERVDRGAVSRLLTAAYLKAWDTV
jgi:uncharacterized protein